MGWIILCPIYLDLNQLDYQLIIKSSPSALFILMKILENLKVLNLFIFNKKTN